MKAQLYYFNKKTNKIARTHDQIYRDTKYITRANDSTKIIGNKNTRHLLTKLVEDLAANNNKVIYVSHEEITEFTECGEKQNKNILTQLADILEYRYIRKKAKFEIKYTHNGLARVTNPSQFYAVKSGKNDNKNFRVEAKKLPRKEKKISSSTLYNIETKEKELEKIAFSYIFSNSVLNVDRMGIDTNSENAALPTPTSKPRIRVQAWILKTSTLVTEQTDLLCYPERAASQPCSTENENDGLVGNSDKLNQSGQPETSEVSRYGNSRNEIKATPTVRENRTNDPSTSTLQKTQFANRTEPLKLAKAIALTPSQEREHYRNHRSRDVESRTEFTAVADVFTLANLLPATSAELAHVEQSPTANRGFLGQFPNNPQEEDAMKAYDWEDPAKKLDLAIVRNFDTATAQELTIHVGYDYIAAENKMRLSFKKKLVVSEHNKNRLKQLIKDIYGDDTEIVTTAQNAKKADVVKITRSQEKFEAHSEQPPKTQEIEEVFERFIPTDEDELLKLADEIREKSNERAVNRDDDTFDFNARIEQLLTTDPQIFRI
jgi:hypothetical protein